MDATLLIDAIVRQTTVLIGALAKASGQRPQLEFDYAPLGLCVVALEHRLREHAERFVDGQVHRERREQRHAEHPDARLQNTQKAGS